MLGTIIAVEENMVYVKLNPQVTNIGNIANSFVVFESSASNIVGEVINVKENILHINLVGQIKDNVFVTGISKKPSLDSAVKVISKEKIPFIIGMPTYKENRDLLLGTSPIYDNVQIGVNVNDFFSKHFAKARALIVVNPSENVIFSRSDDLNAP